MPIYIRRFPFDFFNPSFHAAPAPICAIEKKDIQSFSLSYSQQSSTDENSIYYLKILMKFYFNTVQAHPQFSYTQIYPHKEHYVYILFQLLFCYSHNSLSILSPVSISITFLAKKLLSLRMIGISLSFNSLGPPLVDPFHIIKR